MTRLISLGVWLALSALLALSSSNSLNAQTRSVGVNTSGTLVAPLNFFVQNDAQIRRGFNSFRLTNYVLSATNTLSGSADTSAAAYFPSNNTFFIIRNNAPRDIREYDLAGNLVRTITTTGLTDPEGLCWMYGNTFAVIDEDTALIHIWTIGTNTTTLNTNTSTIINTGLPVDVSSSNGGLEGITYDPGRQTFYLCKENGNPTVYSCTVAGVTNGVFVQATYTAITNAIPAGGLQFDFSDLYYDGSTDSLFILSDDATNITQVTLAGAVIGRRVLSTPTGAPMFTQAEGICFTPDGRAMIVTGEVNQFAIYYEWEQSLPLFLNNTNGTPRARNATSGTPGTPGTVAHWMQFELNGTNCWIPFYR